MKNIVLNYSDVINLFYINEEVSFNLILTYVTVKNQNFTKHIISMP